MNRSMMPKQIMAYNQGGIASFVPQQTQIMGQPHRLAYVNPQEEQMMLNAGGAGLPGPGGMPAYWTLTEPSTWAGGSNYEPGAGFQGIGNFNASDNNNAAATNNSDDNDSTPTFNSLSEASKAGYHGQAVNIAGKGLQKVEFADDSYNTQMSNASAAASNDTPGVIDSILMSIGAKKKTPGYNAAVALNLANSLLPYNPTANDDNNNVVDSVNETGTDETVDGEEEIQYTQMKPFYGGYQPSTMASTLVPSQLTRPTGANPRLDPIFPQQPPSDFYIDDGFPPIDPGFNIDDGRIRNFDFGAPANLGDTHYDPELDTTYTYQEKPDGQGGFYSGWDITQGTGPKMVLYGGGGSQGLMNNDISAQGVGTNFGTVMPEINPLTGLPQTASTNSGGQFNSLAELDAFQQQYPSANLMGEYQRLRALEGGIPAVAQLPDRGVASIFGNEQAPQYMYQGIMG